jgi:uncharacterized protein (TIGR03435 family)
MAVTATEGGVMRALVLGVAVVVLGFAFVSGQPRATFDVAAVKVNRSGQIPMRITAPLGRFEATNVTPQLLILNAFRLRDFQLTNVPGWAAEERFDVTARTASPAARDEVSAMVRALLEDRFQLRTHRETRDMPTYALVFATPARRLGPGMRISTADCANDACNTRITPSSLVATGMTMARLAVTLSNFVGRVVTDESGLEGAYDLDLKFAPDQPAPGAALTQADADAPSVFTALREQLGLRLDGRRGPVDVLVVDRLERPTPD